jgi:hypothetical protein
VGQEWSIVNIEKIAKGLKKSLGNYLVVFDPVRIAVRPLTPQLGPALGWFGVSKEGAA